VTPVVTFAVVSWNTRELLDRCLESLAPEVEAGTAAVWVVDNASSDGSPELISERYPRAQLRALDTNLGFGPAVNLVAREAPRTEWLAPANADIALEPGALAHLLQAGTGDPQAGALAPRLVLPDGTTQHSVHPFPTIPLALGFNAGLQRVLPRWGDRMCLEGCWDPDRARRVPWALGACLLVRREAWDAIGGFDDQQWMYAEDVEIGWRLAKAGRPTRYVPDARVQHESSASTLQAFGAERERTRRWQRNTYAWMLRRRGWTRTRAVAAVNVAGAGARWAASAVRGRTDERATYAFWARAHASGLRRARWLEGQR
jgi:N-acetylglucosaminyl-diphospho-decaprenol L-rhamnosyltransferase